MRPCPKINPPAPAAPPGPAWTRKDDKLLELLLFSPIVSIRDIPNLVGRTPEQVRRRRDSMVAEIRHVLDLEAPEPETPREWEMQMRAAATTAVAPAAAAAEEELDAAVLVQRVAAEDAGSAAPMVVRGGGKRSEEGQGRNNAKTKGAKKTAVMWTEDEHRAFLAGLDKYKGHWKTMSMEYLPTKSPSQIASHHQKYCIRLKQRERNECKRASIHDITEPGNFAADAVSGAEAAASARELEGELPNAPGEEDEPREPAPAVSNHSIPRCTRVFSIV